MRLGLQRAALAKPLAHAAHRRHTETGKLCDLSRVLALLIKFENALPQGDRYGSHAPTLPQALVFFKLHYLCKCSSRWKHRHDQAVSGTCARRETTPVGVASPTDGVKIRQEIV